MASLEGVVKDSYDKYIKIIRLREVDSKEDPENEPYRSKYAARDLLNDIRNNLDPELNPRGDVNDEQLLILNAISAHVEFYFGLLAAEVEEFPTAEEKLLKSLKISEDHETTQTHVLTCLKSYNELGVLWSLRGDNKQAAEYLKRSAQLSQKYRVEVELPPYSPHDLFKFLLNQDLNNDIDNWKLFEDVLTHGIYYLAQAFTSIEEPAKAAVCYELTLRRQLDGQEFDGIDWAVNAATLSQFFISENNFSAARHLLACATKVLEDHSCQTSTNNIYPDEPDDTPQKACIKAIHFAASYFVRKADIARCWAKYGNLLLNVSWNELMKSGEEMGQEKGDSEKGERDLEKPKEVDVGFNLSGFGGRDPHKMFQSLGAEEIEKQITADKVLVYQDARLVFLNAQSWLNAAKEYYTFEDHASDYIQISQDMSQLFKILAQFEPDTDRRCKMHKRRINLLEDVLKGVNPKYYFDFCRQIYFEVGETYTELMDLKLSILNETTATATQHAVLKVHSLAVKAIQSFQSYVNSYKSNGELPDELPENFARPILLAHVFMGRLHSKRNAKDVKSTIEYLQESMVNYKYVVDYCERHPETASIIQHELSVTKEMVNLLPIKMEKIAAENFT
ncbi:hypothetical protein CHUAL_004946 [Chamberlinius hualienensis]